MDISMQSVVAKYWHPQYGWAGLLEEHSYREGAAASILDTPVSQEDVMMDIKLRCIDQNGFDGLAFSIGYLVVNKAFSPVPNPNIPFERGLDFHPQFQLPF